jgi:hypothetical protein
MELCAQHTERTYREGTKTPLRMAKRSLTTDGVSIPLMGRRLYQHDVVLNGAVEFDQRRNPTEPQGGLASNLACSGAVPRHALKMSRQRHQNSDHGVT